MIFAILLIAISGFLLFRVRNEGKFEKPQESDEVSIDENIKAKKESGKPKVAVSETSADEVEMDDYFIPGFETAVKMLEENVSGFDINDYRIMTSNGSYTTEANTNTVAHTQAYINLMYKIGDFITDSGYVIVLDGETGNFLQLNDDMKKIPQNYDSDDFTMTEDDNEYYLEPADIEKEEIIYYYDSAANQRVAIVSITMKDGGGPMVETYEIEDREMREE